MVPSFNYGVMLCRKFSAEMSVGECEGVFIVACQLSILLPTPVQISMSDFVTISVRSAGVL